MAPFKSVNSWGVKDASGAWLCANVRQHQARRVYEEHPQAKQLFNGMDPFDVLIDPTITDNYWCKLVEEK